MVSCFLNSSGLQLWQTPVASETNSSVEFQKQHVDFEIRGADNSLNDLLTTAELTLIKFLSLFLTNCIFFPKLYIESRNKMYSVSNERTHHYDHHTRTLHEIDHRKSCCILLQCTRQFYADTSPLSLQSQLS